MKKDLIMAKAKVSPELSECIQSLRSVLRDHLHLISLVIAIILKHPSTKTIDHTNIENDISLTVAPMLQAIGSSANTLVALSDSPGLQTRDCYSICRSIVEGAINVTYIIAEGSIAAKRALRHTRQQSYRNLQQDSQIGGMTISYRYTSIPDPQFIDGLEEDIQEFTSRKGRRKNWNDLSIRERIEAIGKQLGESTMGEFHFAYFMIYQDSSEILHGTHFGAAFFLGLTQPTPLDVNLSFQEKIGQHHMLLLMASIAALQGVAKGFHCRYNCPCVQQETEELSTKLLNIEYLKKDKANKRYMRH